ncbi:MAG TPA: sensor domain-containing protein [Mycobacterium sp.]|nr:sensor domain-containing protein [Mycobacterium sp.]
MLPVGALVAGYRIKRVLGAGGMGTVYLVHNPTLPRREALKVLSAELSRNQDFRARFVREADVAAVLAHPNIVSVYRRGETEDGQLWIAMQFVDGTDADGALRAGTMTPERAVHVVGEIAKALDYAHWHNVVHRDVKPGNFLLSTEGGGIERVLLADFGIARALDDVGLTVTGSLVATVTYAAPEVLAGLRFDHRADLYSLGCSLFRLLTGKTPFPAEGGVPAMMLAHLQQPPPRVTDWVPHLPAALDSVIATAMAKDPGQRFQTAGSLAVAATEALHGLATPHTAPWQAIPSQDVRSYPRVPVTTPWWRPESGPRTMFGPVSPPPAQWTTPGAPPAPRRQHRWIIAAATTALVVAAGVSAAILMAPSEKHTAGQPITSSAPTSSAPPVTVSDLKSLLLGADEVGTILHAQVNPGPIGSLGTDWRKLVEKDCVAPWLPGQQSVYNGSGWQAAAVQALNGAAVAEQPADQPMHRMVIQSVVGFPTAELATTFFTNQKAQWAQCANRKVSYLQDPGQPPALVSMGGFSTTGDGILTMTNTGQGAMDWICVNALWARNNISIGGLACSISNAGDQAVDVVHQIAAKIPPG